MIMQAVQPLTFACADCGQQHERGTDICACECGMCQMSPCACPQNNEPQQKKVLAHLYGALDSIDTWLTDTESPAHDVSCNCCWCEDIRHTQYMLTTFVGILESNMLCSRMEKDWKWYARASLQAIARRNEEERQAWKLMREEREAAAAKAVRHAM